MKFFIFAVLLFSSSAFALTETIQTLTPGARQFEGNLDGEYGFGSLSTNGTPSINVDVNGYHFMGSAYYGFDANNSFGIGTAYQSIKGTTKFGGLSSIELKVEGFDGIALGYKGNYDLLEAGTLFLSAQVIIPTEKGNQNEDTGKSTITDGQITTPIAVGFVVPIHQAKIGALLTYTFTNTGSGSVESSGIKTSYDIKDGGGYQLDVFSEFPRAMNLNVDLQYQRTYTVHTDALFGGDNTWKTGSETIGLIVKARIPVAQGFEIIPVASYETLVHLSEAGYSQYNLYTVGADARFLF